MSGIEKKNGENRGLKPLKIVKNAFTPGQSLLFCVYLQSFLRICHACRLKSVRYAAYPKLKSALVRISTFFDILEDLYWTGDIKTATGNTSD